MTDDEFDVLMDRWIQRNFGNTERYPYGVRLKHGYVMGYHGDSNYVVSIVPNSRPLTQRQRELLDGAPLNGIERMLYFMMINDEFKGDDTQ